MLLIYVNGNLIENMIIQEDKLLFSDVDSNEDLIYKTVPVNEYEEGTDKYLEVESVFKDILELDSEEGRKIFKDLCLLEHEKGIDSFTFEDLKIFLEEIPDNEEIVIV